MPHFSREDGSLDLPLDPTDEYWPDPDDDLFQTVFNETAIATALFTIEGVFIRANPGFCALLGYEEDELLGRPYKAFVNGEALAPTDDRRLAALANSHESKPTELPYVDKAGRTVWLYITGVLLRDLHGRPHRFLAQFQDVTSRREAERQLRESEERFRVAFADAPTGMALLTPDGRYEQVNRALCSMFGYADNELFGRPASFNLKPGELDRVEVYRDGLDSTEPRVFELTYHHRDGRPLRILVSGTLLRDARERPLHFLFQYQDVTERRAAEQALRASEERFRVAFEQGPYGMALATLDGRFVQVNQALARILGFTPNDLIGKTFADVLAPDDRPVLPSLSDGERRVVRRDGSVIWASCTTTVVHDGDGRAVYLISHVQDVTERRQQEEARIQLEERLRRSQRMEAVGRLAGGIAHDFNNMLAVILNYADFACQRAQADPKTVDYLEAIRKAALRSSGLTRQLMIFARRDVATPQVLDVNMVVDELAQLLKRTLGEDMELALELTRDLWKVRLAVTHAEQVLMNLTVNARDAMPRGGRLFVRTRNVTLDAERASRHVGAQAGPYVQLSVQDTGVGMTPEVLAVAFEPFFTTKELGQGTGLGLSIVYGIVDDAGGFIDVTSTPGVGTTFHIYLPATDASAQVEDPAPPSPLPQGLGEAVLVVEDEPAVRALTAQILEEHGFFVETADTPEAALERCRRRDRPFDLLLTDVVMPRISGTDLATLVTALRPGTRVLFMSGHADERLGLHRVRAGEVAFLQKPFNREQLLRSVKGVLDTP